MMRRHSFATVLVGKNTVRREGLAKILSSANFRILASVSCADDLLSCKIHPSQLLFLIVPTGDDFDAAVEQVELFKDRHPEGRIAIVADRYRLSELVAAFRAGVTGYFVDVMSCDVFIKSMELVMMGETVFPPAFLSFALDTEEELIGETGPCDDRRRTTDATEDGIARQLSPREKSILRCLIEGDSNKCIARKIDIAEATVKVHIKAILRKIGVQNRTQAAIWGMKNRWPRTSNNRPQHASTNVSGRFSTTEPEIGDAVPVGVISHAANQLDASRVERDLRKDIDHKANGAIRFRK